MPKLGSIPRVFGDFDGDEDVVMAKDGLVGRGKIGGLVSSLAAPFVTQARDAANVATAAAEFAFGREIYATAAAGIADTAPGDYFFTPSDDAEDFLILWLHGDDGTAQEQARSPSRAILAALQAAAALASGAATTASARAIDAATAADNADDKAAEADAAAGSALAAAAAASAAADKLAVTPIRHMVATDEMGTFMLPMAPLHGLLVIVNGVILDPDDYVLVGAALAFVDPLVRGDRLLVLPYQSLLAATVALEHVIGLGPATNAQAGLMSAADKAKVDGMASGATANSSDAFLRGRANHTGVQPISTVIELGNRLGVNAVDYGAVGDGATDCLAAINAAITAGVRELRFTKSGGGTASALYYLSAAPVAGAVPFAIVVEPGAFVVGPGAAALGIRTSTHRQIVQLNNDPNHYAAFSLRQYNKYAGGDPGYASRVLDVEMTVGPDCTDGNWAITSVAKSHALNATGEHGVSAACFQVQQLAVGNCWAAVAEAVDLTNSASTGRGELNALEIDIRCNGEDTAAKRTGLLLVCSDIQEDWYGDAGLPGSATYGIRSVNRSGSAVKWKVGMFEAAATIRSFQAASTGETAYDITGTYGVGLDFSLSTISIAAIRLKLGHKLFWSQDGGRAQYHDGAGLRFDAGGVLRFRANDDGTTQRQILTVGTLPTVGTGGREGTVADSSVTAFYTIVAAGGAHLVPVFETPTGWRVA